MKPTLPATRALRYALLCVLVCGWAGAPAGAAPSRIPPAEALRMGMEQFVEAYTDRTGDHSEAGYDEAAITYGKHRASANDALLRKLPTGRLRLARSARKALQEWDAAFHEMEYLACGGGTMYTHAAIRAVGPREDQIARLAGVLSRSTARDRRARAEAEGLMRRIDAYVARTAKLPAALDETASILPDGRKRYPEVHRRLRRATDELRRLARSLPDPAARELLARPAEKVRSAEETG